MEQGRGTHCCTSLQRPCIFGLPLMKGAISAKTVCTEIQFHTPLSVGFQEFAWKAEAGLIASFIFICHLPNYSNCFCNIFKDGEEE